MDAQTADQYIAHLGDFFNRVKGAQLGERSTAMRLFNYIRKNRRNPDIPSSATLDRTAVPAEKVTEEQLTNAGFLPSYVAVPEAGQSQLKTLRHPKNGVHFHRHGDSWLMHEDTYPSLQMLMAKWRMDHPEGTYKDRLKYYWGSALPSSLGHIMYEGIPGYTGYVAGRITGSDPLDVRESGRSLPARIGRAGLGYAGVTGGVSLLSRLTSGGWHLPEAAAGTAGFLGGNYAARALQRKLSERGYARKGSLSALLLLAGGPLATAAGSAYAANRLSKPKN